MGWSMGGGTVLLVGEDLSFSDLQASIIIGSSTDKSSIGSNLTYPNITNPPNLLVAAGKNDELFSIKKLLENMKFLIENSPPVVEFDKIYGYFQNGTARKITAGKTDHLFETVDPDIISASVDWFRQAFNISSPRVYIRGVVWRELWSLLSGLSWLSLLFLLVTFSDRTNPIDYEDIDPLSKEWETKRKNWWFLLHNVVWVLCFIGGLIFNFIPFPVLFLGLVIGWFLFASVAWYFIYWKLSGLSLKEALIEPWKNGNKRIISITGGLLAAFYFILQLLLYNVPWSYSLSVPLFKSLEQLGSMFFRRYLLFFFLFLVSFPAFIYELEVIHRMTKPKFYWRHLLEIISARIWLFLLIFFILTFGSMIKPGVFGLFSFMALFLYTLTGAMLLLSIMVSLGRHFLHNPVSLCVIQASIVSYIVAQLLPFSK